MIAVLILALISSLVICPIIIFREWRGEVVDQSLTCGRCRFDLDGLPTPVTICPECGCDFVSSPRKLKHELRQRRWLRLGPAIAIPLILIIMLGSSLLSRPGRQIMLRVGPASFARSQLFLGGIICDDALSELQSRIVNGTLSPAEKDELVAYLLARQADQSREWRTKMGDVIMAARTAGVVSDADWVKFAAGCVSVTAKCRSNVRSGDPIPISVTVASARVGATGMPPILGVRIGSSLVAPADSANAALIGSAIANASPTYFVSGPQAGAPGQHDVFVTVGLELAGATTSPSSGIPVPVATNTFTLPMLVVGPDVETVARRRDPDAAVNLKNVLHVQEATIIAPFDESPPQLRLVLRADARPTNVAFDVYARRSTSDGIIDPEPNPEVLMGHIHGTTNAGYSTWTLLQPFQPRVLFLKDPKVDIVLRPSPIVARGTVDVDWYLDETIEIVDYRLNVERANR